MNGDTFAALIQNAALLLALAVVFDVTPDRFALRKSPLYGVLVGLVLGALSVAIMLKPLILAPGIVFDTRSVLLAVTGLFFGPVATVVAMGMTAGLRLAAGGDGTWAGIAVIVASGSIGLAWARLRTVTAGRFELRELYVFGLVVHVVMVGLMLTLPLGAGLGVIAAVALPVIVIYPVATALLARTIDARRMRQDVTEALGESEERLRLVLEAARLGMYDLDLRTGDVTTNAQYATMLGFDPATFRESSVAFVERLHPDDRAAVSTVHGDYVEGRIPDHGVEFRQRTASGHWKWILSAGRVVERLVDGTPTRLIGTHMDISDRRAAEDAARDAAGKARLLLEEEVHLRRALLSVAEDQRHAVAVLRESEERYRSLIDHSPVAIFVNRDDRLVIVNDACRRLFGAESAFDLLGRSPMELFHPDDLEAVAERIRVMRETGVAVDPREERIVRIDGSLLDVEVAAAPFEDHGTRSIHVVLVDITERKAAERAIREVNEELERRVAARTALLEHANQELETFSYSVSHDLRAPLRAVAGFAEILGRRYRDRLDDNGAHYLDNIIEGGQHMGVLIEELLEYSRLGRSRVRLEPVPLEPILERLAVTFADRIAADGGRLEVRAPLAVPCGDPILLEQVLVNLLDNALTYRRGDVAPLVTVSAERHAARVVITVADNGIGIAPEHSEKVFEVFARLHRDDEYEGTGIGLATVRKAARLMGTDVTLTSTVGVGTTFTLDLPAPADGSGP